MQAKWEKYLRIRRRHHSKRYNSKLGITGNDTRNCWTENCLLKYTERSQTRFCIKRRGFLILKHLEVDASKLVMVSKSPTATNLPPNGYKASWTPNHKSSSDRFTHFTLWPNYFDATYTERGRALEGRLCCSLTVGKSRVKTLCSL